MTVQDFSSTRAAMVASQLRTNEVSNPRVADAFLSVERERFVPPERSSVAYTDLPIPLGGGRALNTPLSTARLISQIMPTSAQNILIVGAATGYSAAILAQLGCKVIALEEAPALADIAKANLANAHNVMVVTGALAQGWSNNAPYDVIIIDGAIEALSPPLIDQCAEGGRVAAAVVDGGVVRLAIGRKVSGAVVLVPFAECQSVILPGFAAVKEFVF